MENKSTPDAPNRLRRACPEAPGKILLRALVNENKRRKLTFKAEPSPSAVSDLHCRETILISSSEEEDTEVDEPESSPNKIPELEEGVPIFVDAPSSNEEGVVSHFEENPIPGNDDVDKIN